MYHRGWAEFTTCTRCTDPLYCNCLRSGLCQTQIFHHFLALDSTEPPKYAKDGALATNEESECLIAEEIAICENSLLSAYRMVLMILGSVDRHTMLSWFDGRRKSVFLSTSIDIQMVPIPTLKECNINNVLCLNEERHLAAVITNTDTIVNCITQSLSDLGLNCVEDALNRKYVFVQVSNICRRYVPSEVKAAVVVEGQVMTAECTTFVSLVPISLVGGTFPLSRIANAYVVQVTRLR